MANVVVSALATWNGRALNKGKKDIASFDKSVKALGRTFGVTFSAAALIGFSKKAIKAFSDDEAAAKRLELQLQNTGNAFRVDEVEEYIKSLEKTNAILVDLRGPFQTLLNLTGSVELAQRSLEVALNTSAGTGETLNTVISAISSGLRGQTKGIKNLNTGIDANIIATGDMNSIMSALEKRFSGQAAARLNTYAGKMNVLAKGAEEATKAIGEGLVDSLTLLSKDQSVQSIADSFENLGDNIAFATLEMAKLIKSFNDLVSAPTFKAGLLATGLLLSGRTGNPQYFVGALGLVGGSSALGLASKDYGLGSQGGTPFGQAGSASQLSIDKQKKAAADLLKLRAKENALIKEKNALEDLKKKYDEERIGLMLALNQATDEETRLRIAEKLAILDGNAAKAQQYLADTELAFQTNQLAKSMNNAALSAESFSKFAMGAIQRGEYADAYKNISNVPTQSAGGAMQLPSSASSFAMGGVSRGEYAPVTVNVAGSVLTEQDLTNTINETLLRINKMGRGTTPAGGLSGGT
jgi:hypothetical protein